MRLWLDSSVRDRITDAAREVDTRLSTQPESIGELVHEGMFAFEVAPLRIQFSIEEDDRIVRVWTVRLIDK